MMEIKTLQVGYARQRITPDYPIGISGYGDAEIRRSEGVVDDLYLTCIAIAQGAETILLYTADLLSIDHWAAEKIRERVTPLTGIPGEKIFCGATHNHSGPMLYEMQEDTVRFRGEFLIAAEKVAQAAVADLAPAEMYSIMQEVPGMNFVRHYLMNDGTYCGSNFGSARSGFKAHAAPSDPRMVLVSFRRAEKPDVVMMNWQAHNDNVRQVGYYFLSSSYVGHIRKEFEKNTGMHFAFFMGASGNQNRDSLIESEAHGLDYIAYGEKLAQIAEAALCDMKPVADTGIQTHRVMFEAEVDHSWDHMVAQADEVFHLWKTVGKKEGDALGKTYGFTSSYQSRDIRIRAKMGKTVELELNAFRIGDLGFVTSTNEVFSTVGLYTRANSPFETTFIITGNARYLPAKEAYDYRSYESDTGLYAKGTAEKVAEKWVSMLETVK